MKIVKWLVVILVGVPLLILAGIYIRNKAVGPAGWARDNTARQLKVNLKHPDSMVLRSSYTIKVPGAASTTLFLCGVVDAKDDAGAYTGGLRFVSKSIDDNAAGTFDTLAVVIEDPAQTIQAGSQHVLSAFESGTWNAHCVDATHPPLTLAAS